MPLACSSAKALMVQSLSYLLAANILSCHIEHSLYYLYCDRAFWLRLNLVPSLHAITDSHFMKAIGWPAAVEEAPRSILTHTSLDVLAQVGTNDGVHLGHKRRGQDGG